LSRNLLPTSFSLTRPAARKCRHRCDRHRISVHWTGYQLSAARNTGCHQDRLA